MDRRLGGFYVSCYLLLVALTCLSVAEGRPGYSKRSIGLFGEMIDNIRDRIRTGMETVFRFPTTTTTTTESPFLPDEELLTTREEGRDIIRLPARCPPNSVLINGRCRKQIF